MNYVIYKDENGKLYQMKYGIEKVYLTEKEIKYHEMLERTEKETRGKDRILDPFVGYMLRNKA